MMMQRKLRGVLGLFAVAAAAWLLTGPPSLQAAGGKNFGGIDAKVVAEWEQAGARFAWLTDARDEMLFGDFADKGSPAFLIAARPAKGWKALPAPGVSFGLILDGKKAEEAKLDELSDFQQLHKLGFFPAQVTDAGLKGLSALKQLKTLDLSNALITDEGLKELPALKALQTLFLDKGKITDAGLKHLAGLQQLQKLGLSNTLITDEGLKELAGLQALQVLDLKNTKVTDAGLKHLAGLKQLQTLYVEETRVTEAGVNELRKALPKVDVLGVR
jgi:hypothetical protein